MTNSQEKDHWSADAYQKAAGFVPKLAMKVVEWLDVQPDDNILDIGCGDGVLTGHIAQSLTTGSILGIDSSASMITSANQLKQTTLTPTQSDHCHFLTLNAHDLLSNLPALHLPPLTKVFSNAALHWILATTPSNQTAVFQGIHSALQHPDNNNNNNNNNTTGGLFVFEMGGSGNVTEMRAALRATVAKRVGAAAAQAADPWFFPDEAWMRDALEGHGFAVERLELEARPTRVQEGEGGGIEGWVRLMGSRFFDVIADAGEREECIVEAVRRLEGECRVEDGGYVMGYVRLRGEARRV